MLALINLRRQASAGGLWAASGSNGTSAPCEIPSSTKKADFRDESSTNMGPLSTVEAKMLRSARGPDRVGTSYAIVSRE